MFHLTNVFWDLVETGVIVPIQTMHYVGGKSPNCTIDSIRFASSLIPQNWVPFHKVADLSPIHFRKRSATEGMDLTLFSRVWLRFRAKSATLVNYLSDHWVLVLWSEASNYVYSWLRTQKLWLFYNSFLGGFFGDLWEVWQFFKFPNSQTFHFLGCEGGPERKVFF